MVSFWIQWIIPCLAVIFKPIHGNDEIIENLYWLTYTVCVSDPIMVFFFNRNITLRKINQ